MLRKQFHKDSFLFLLYLIKRSSITGKNSSMWRFSLCLETLCWNLSHKPFLFATREIFVSETMKSVESLDKMRSRHLWYQFDKLFIFHTNTSKIYSFYVNIYVCVCVYISNVEFEGRIKPLFLIRHAIQNRHTSYVYVCVCTCVDYVRYNQYLFALPAFNLTHTELHNLNQRSMFCLWSRHDD